MRMKYLATMDLGYPIRNATLSHESFKRLVKLAEGKQTNDAASTP